MCAIFFCGLTFFFKFWTQLISMLTLMWTFPKVFLSVNLLLSVLLPFVPCRFFLQLWINLDIVCGGPIKLALN